MAGQHLDNDDNFTYRCDDGTTITVSRAFRRECPVCNEAKSIADFSFRKMKPGAPHFRDQPMCGSCRAQRRPSKPPAAA